MLFCREFICQIKGRMRRDGFEANAHMKKLLLSLLVTVFCNLVLFAQKKQVTVAGDGSGDYRTVQAAFDAVPLNNKKEVVIFVKNGFYKEKLHLDSTKNFVTLRGEDRFRTILAYDDYSGKVTAAGASINTLTSASFVVKADDFRAENITIRNDAGFSAGQAVGLEIRGDKAFLCNCRIIGNQDILFLNSERSRQCYVNCYIEGTTDFIFGAATAWFEHCHIYSKKNSHVTAASTPQTNPFGFVFYDCILTGDSTVHSASLGRPWRPYASVCYLNCYIGQHIRPEGWSAWNKLDTYTLSRYAEFGNYGPGASEQTRVRWSKQLTEEQAAGYLPKIILRGWKPRKH